MKTKTHNLLKNLNKNACIVLGIDTPTGLSIVRSLGSKGIPVIGITSFKFALGQFSKYCSTYEFCPTEEDTISFLQEASRICKYKNVIICESDKYLLFLDKYKIELKESFALTIPLDISLSTLMNKENMIKLAKEAGLDVPITFFPNEASKNNFLEEIPYPCFVKPPYTQTRIRTKGEIAKDKNDLEETLLNKRFKGNYLLQEIIQGPEVNFWECYGYRNNHINYCVTFHKLKQIPKDFGVGVEAISKRNEEIEKLTNKFLNHIKYNGLFELEFKKDSRDGKYKFLEINPRICLQNQLAMSLGLDLAYIAYLDALDMEIDGFSGQKDGILWFSIIDDFIACVKYYIRDNKFILLDWMKKMLAADSYAVFRLDDLQPFVFNILSHLLRINRNYS